MRKQLKDMSRHVQVSHLLMRSCCSTNIISLIHLLPCPLTTNIFILAGKHEGFRDGSSSGGQIGQGASSQQQQQLQDDSVETYQQSYLSSGKFNFIYFMEAYV